MGRKSRSAAASQRRLRDALRRWMNRCGDKSPSVSVRRNLPIPGTFNIKVVSKTFRGDTLNTRFGSLDILVQLGRMHGCDFRRIVAAELWAPGEE